MYIYRYKRVFLYTMETFVCVNLTDVCKFPLMSIAIFIIILILIFILLFLLLLIIIIIFFKV